MHESGSTRKWFVVATLLLGVCAMVGVLLPWAHGLELHSKGLGRSSVYGFSYVQGVAAFVGALGLTVVSARHALRRISDVQYVAFGTAMCTLALAASVWFWTSEVGVVDPFVRYSLIDFFRLPRISAGVGLYVTGSSALAGLLCLLGFAVDAKPRVNGLRIVHDERNLDGGSLIPNRLRFRITRRVHTVP